MFYLRHVLGKQLSDISRVVFQTLRFEKVRDNDIFYNIMYQKASNVAFQTCGLKKYGKNVRENGMFYNVKRQKSRVNSKKIWKIQKKSKLNSEEIGEIWKKDKLNCEMIWKMHKKSKLNSENKEIMEEK